MSEKIYTDEFGDRRDSDERYIMGGADRVIKLGLDSLKYVGMGLIGAAFFWGLIAAGYYLSDASDNSKIQNRPVVESRLEKIDYFA